MGSSLGIGYLRYGTYYSCYCLVFAPGPPGLVVRLWLCLGPLHYSGPHSGSARLSLLGLYRRFWRCASVDDLARVLVAVFASTAVLTLAFVGAQVNLARYDLALLRSLPVLDGMPTLLAVAGFRSDSAGYCGYAVSASWTAAENRRYVQTDGRDHTQPARDLRLLAGYKTVSRLPQIDINHLCAVTQWRLIRRRWMPL